MVTTTEYGAIQGETTAVDVADSFYSKDRLTVKRRVIQEYDPTDWLHTILAVYSKSYVSAAFYFTAVVGTILVLISRLPIFAIPPEHRECRAWCSALAIGPQVHQYMGIILFLVMAFRKNAAVQNYNAGVRSFFAFKNTLRAYVNTLLNKVPQETVSVHARARALGLAVAFPYAVVADLRLQREFDAGYLDGVLSPSDIAEIQAAPTLPMSVLETLTTHISREFGDKARGLHGTLNPLIPPYGECERILQNPIALSYVAHLRVLLLAYLITLPLCLLENMGWSTIPVVWIIDYALMSLEMLAVDVECPFDGKGKSDLHLLEACDLMKEQALESWQRWSKNSGCKISSHDEKPYNVLPSAY